MLEHWNRETEHLVAVGDLIDRGNYSSLVMKHCMALSRDYAHSTFIKGNHEVEIIEHFTSGYNHNWTGAKPWMILKPMTWHYQM